MLYRSVHHVCGADYRYITLPVILIPPIDPLATHGMMATFSPNVVITD